MEVNLISEGMDYLFRRGHQLFDNEHSVLNTRSNIPGDNIGMLFAAQYREQELSSGERI